MYSNWGIPVKAFVKISLSLQVPKQSVHLLGKREKGAKPKVVKIEDNKSTSSRWRYIDPVVLEGVEAQS